MLKWPSGGARRLAAAAAGGGHTSTREARMLKSPCEPIISAAVESGAACVQATGGEPVKDVRLL